ncbi:inter-alpha-trypsin inhibitor heavy chain H4-like isoform X2 [Scleropages formosus]|uniref:inter-alpha-trypsin inhibitor heavy chain H4-like isoform X2 n=1 Tax=Scleropages formosus TaxID=113540 RepID=UPI0008780361|nr:inter-alpha-trypsin inhibitor heavy chain H4-like isoform X2 [Scleropages formosus]
MLLLALSLLLAAVSSVPVQKEEQKDHGIDIYSFHIKSEVRSRYAMTVITSRVANLANESREVNFHVEMPKHAFISNFSMTMDGQTYNGVVKKKAEAQQQYDKAVSRGQSAGLVSSVGRTLEEFTTSVTVAAHKKVTFELTYEQLLKRRLGQYELLIKAKPTQVVKDFKIDVHIRERQGIRFLDTRGELVSTELSKVVNTTLSEKEARVLFAPTRQQQRQCPGCGADGLSGDLLIVYDVNRPKTKGDLQISQGYFVHYFAPTDVNRTSKNVVFIIDQSGSMHGRKIEQTREALLKILDDVPEDDHFALITFDSTVRSWKPQLVRATPDNLEAARSFVRKIQDLGATDINAAVLEGVRMLKVFTDGQKTNKTASILILLTDGDPTSGVTNLDTIRANVKEAIGRKYTLYCLGFGFDVNYEFLEKMALQNDGVGRRIYPDSDAALQLQGFYEEVATPLLSDVEMNYAGVSDVTQTTFSQYYNGSEIVVAGHVTDNELETLRAVVKGYSEGNEVKYEDASSKNDDATDAYISDVYIQRLWAYLTVQQLLEKEVLLSGSDKEAIRERALNLSLKYSFVTPLTSMVVTKPEGDKSQVLHKPKEGKPGSKETSNMRRGFRPQTLPDAGGISHRMVGPSYKSRVSMPNRNPLGIRPPDPHARLHHSPPQIAMHIDYMDSPLVKLADVTGVVDYDNLATHVPHDTDADYGIWATRTPAPESGRTLRIVLPAAGQNIPLCFDVPVPYRLTYKLLEDSAAGLLVLGQVGVARHKDFQQLSIRTKDGGNVTVDTSHIQLSKGQQKKLLSWHQSSARHQSNRLSLLKQDHVLEVTVGGTRIDILLHKEGQEHFLWPAVKERPLGSSATGLMEQHRVSYEEKQVSPSVTLEIQGHQTVAQRNSATDYSAPSRPTVSCWLVPHHSVVQGELSSLTVREP